jgi:hypothetical protein
VYAQLVYTWRKSFLYVHTGEHDEQNVLKLELELFRLKCNASIKQLTIILLVKEVIWTPVFLSSFYLFIIFAGLSKKCIFFMYVTH